MCVRIVRHADSVATATYYTSVICTLEVFILRSSLYTANSHYSTAPNWTFSSFAPRLLLFLLSFFRLLKMPCLPRMILACPPFFFNQQVLREPGPPLSFISSDRSLLTLYIWRRTFWCFLQIVCCFLFLIGYIWFSFCLCIGGHCGQCCASLR